MSMDHTSDNLLRAVLLVLAVIVLLPLLMMLFAMPMMGMMGWWRGGGFSPVWGVGMVLIWLLIFGGIGYLLYRGFVGRTGSSMTTDPAVRELRSAYARGDLSEEEFEERRAKLNRQESN